jgi:signal transduction histidine kinase
MMAVEQLAMSAGWAAAVIALVAAGLLRVRLIRRVALVAEAAHELRGPLTAAGLALHGAGGDPGRLAAAELELRRAGLALEDLVGAPRGRRAAATLQHVDVRAVAGEVVAATRPMAARFGAMVRLELPPGPAGVRADRLRLAQALANLVVNAAEHGGGDVLVRVTPTTQRVRIEVHDGGPGPTPAEFAAAARRWATAGGAGRGAGGMRGHGLAIATRIAADHGGRVFSELVPGATMPPLGARPHADGVALVLDLPRDERRAPAAPPQPPRRTGGFIRSARAPQPDPARTRSGRPPSRAWRRPRTAGRSGGSGPARRSGLR